MLQIAIAGSSEERLKEEDLGRAYQTSLDPRLNYEQALELAMIVSHRLRTVD